MMPSKPKSNDVTPLLRTLHGSPYPIEPLQCPQILKDQALCLLSDSSPTTLSLVNFALASLSSLLVFLHRNFFPALIRMLACFSKLKKKKKKLRNQGKWKRYSNSPIRIKLYQHRDVTEEIHSCQVESKSRKC